MDHNTLWKILIEMGISDQLTYLLRNLYAGQEATVRTWHGTKDWLKIGTGECQGCILSTCLFNFYQCWEPPREIPSMTKVMQKRPDRQRWIKPQGTPWICSSIHPKTKICLSYYFMPFTNSSDINRGLSPTTFLWKSQLRALVNKSPGHERNISILTPLLAFYIAWQVYPYSCN